MTNEELRALVKKSILLSDETRKEILENLETLDAEQRQQLEDLLVDAEKKQDELLLAAFEANPNLLVEIKADIHKATMEDLKERENASNAEEAKTLEELENEINNLFD